MARGVSGDEGLSQRHGASAGSHLSTLQHAWGWAWRPLLHQPGVDCRAGFILPCPDVQCVHCYCCIFPPLKLLQHEKNTRREETVVLRSCKARGLSLLMGVECTETLRAMLDLRDVAQTSPAHVSEALQVQVPSAQAGS